MMHCKIIMFNDFIFIELALFFSIVEQLHVFKLVIKVMYLTWLIKQTYI